MFLCLLLQDDGFCPFLLAQGLITHRSGNVQGRVAIRSVANVVVPHFFQTFNIIDGTLAIPAKLVATPAMVSQVFLRGVLHRQIDEMLPGQKVPAFKVSYRLGVIGKSMGGIDGQGFVQHLQVFLAERVIAPDLLRFGAGIVFQRISVMELGFAIGPSDQEARE